MEKEYRAVVIETPSHQPNRFYCDKDGEPRLWPVTNMQDPQDVVFMLTVNDVNARPVKVVLKTVDDT